MLSQRAIREMLIAVGVAGGVVAVGTVGLIFAAPTLLAPASPAAPVLQLCTLDRKAVFEQSAIGRDADLQFAALKTKMQAEIVAEKKRFDVEAPKLAIHEAQQMMSNLQKRLAEENARLDVVRSLAIETVIKRISPVIAQAGVAGHCSAILDRANFVYVGQANDLTADIVKQVEQKIRRLDPDTLAEIYSEQK